MLQFTNQELALERNGGTSENAEANLMYKSYSGFRYETLCRLGLQGTEVAWIFKIQAKQHEED